MRTDRFFALTMIALGAAIGVAACDSGDGGGGGGAGGEGGATSTTTGGGGSGGGALQWWTTCGDPACGGHTPDPNVPLCTTEMENAACSTPDALCDLGDDCNTRLLCSDMDPKAAGCPISRARYKREIQYLDEASLGRVRDDLLSMPLATWRYVSEDGAGPEHLGFIIDDAPSTPAVARDGEHVDVYGYTSMAVAAIQAQQRQIATLSAELQALRKELDALKQRGKQPKGR